MHEARSNGLRLTSLSRQASYHLACDSYAINGHRDNINDTALDINSDAVAHSVLTFASTTSAVNGTDSGSSNSTKDYEWKGSHRRK